MTKIWIILAAVLVAVAVGAAALVGAFDRSPRPIAETGQQGGGLPAPEIRSEDRVLGQADAPVTILEYSSLTCPHCARFHAEAYPQLRSEYIDTGKVKLVYRDYPLDQVALKAAQIAECAPPERYFGLLQLLFESQTSWAVADDPVAALVRMGKLGGIAEEQARGCLADADLERRILAEQLDGRDRYQIASTPSFIIGGRKYSGALTVEQLREILDPLVP